MKTHINIIKDQINESISVKKKLCEDQETLINIYKVAEQIANAYKNGNKVLLFGNGGSAADSQHIAAEFVGRYKSDRLSLPAIALTTDTSIITAVTNDYEFEYVFTRQIESIGSEGDVAIGISTSGSSGNVLNALKAAQKKKIKAIGMTGKKNNIMMNIVDECICVPSDDTPRIQESHILIGHILVMIVEDILFNQ